MTEKRPLVTVTLFVPVSVSVQSALVVAAVVEVAIQKRMLYEPFATVTFAALVSFPW